MLAGDWDEVIGGKRYTTKTAELIAADDYWDGHNFERRGRNTFLFKTVNGNYFTIFRTCWQGERSTLTPLSLDEAVKAWQVLTEREVSFEEAFPDVKIEDA